jgi:hypothetical protein
VEAVAVSEKPTKQNPHWHFRASLPLVRNRHIKRPVFLGRCSIGEFGGSRTNTTWTLFVFGWVLCGVEKHEWHDRSDKERADEYLSEWSKCEKELRAIRLITMGDELNAEVKKLIRDSLGVDLDEGRIL